MSLMLLFLLAMLKILVNKLGLSWAKLSHNWGFELGVVVEVEVES